MSIHLVPDGLAGERVDAAASRMTGVSRSRVAELIAAGSVLLNGEVVTKSTRVSGGDLLELELSEPRMAQVTPTLVDGIGIVHDDADIVVIDKPAGVAAHPSLGWDGPDVVSHLAAAGFRISTSGAAERQGIVQRLDVGTSGVMVICKGERAYSVLKNAFRHRTVEKTYHALVQDFDATTQAMCDFAGLEWNEAVRGFDSTARRRGVSTASAAQVRRGLYDGTRQWQPYAQWLDPVMPVLEPWLAKFGYAV